MQEFSSPTPPESLDSRSPPLWSYLLGLVAVAVVPLALGASAWLWNEAVTERTKLDQAMSLQAEALSLALEREISGVGDVLDSLGRSPLLEAEDFKAFYEHASRIAESRKALFISLFTTDGRQVLNTARPYGTQLPSPLALAAAAAGPESVPPTGDARSLRRVITDRTRSNSDLFKSLATDKLIFTVDVPIYRSGQVGFVLNMAMEPTAVAPIVRGFTDAGYSFLIIDSRNVVLARSDSDGSAVGTVAGASYVAARAKARDFVGEGAAPSGVRMAFAAHTSTRTNWTTVVATPRSRLDAEVRKSWVTAALALGGTVLLGCTLAALLARRIVQSVVALTDDAQYTAGGPRLHLPAREFFALRSRQVAAFHADQAAAAARQSVMEAELRQEVSEEAHRAKDRFIATLAHELRGPLQVVQLCAFQLRRQPGELERVGDRIARQCAHVSKLVDELMDAAAVARGKVSLERIRLNLVALVESILSDFAGQAEAQRRQISFDASAARVEVLGDEVRLRQIIRNLLDNACRYSPQGSPIRVQLTTSASRAELAIVDVGQGVSPADLQRVFEPFEQLNGGTDHRGGLGLGLPLARDLARLHGGDLVLESEGPGKGCVARFTIPLDPPDNQAG